LIIFNNFINILIKDDDVIAVRREEDAVTLVDKRLKNNRKNSVITATSHVPPPSKKKLNTMINPEKLNGLVCRFYVNDSKKGGNLYEFIKKLCEMDDKYFTLEARNIINQVCIIYFDLFLYCLFSL